MGQKALKAEKQAGSQWATVGLDIDWPEVETLYSDALPINITPYTVEIDYPKLQVPGSHQGWDPANETTVIFSLKSDNNYEGYLNFADPNTEFKYTEGPSWDVNWGDNGADGVLDAGGDNIKAGDAMKIELYVPTRTPITSANANAGAISPMSANDWPAGPSAGTRNLTIGTQRNPVIIEATTPRQL